MASVAPITSNNSILTPAEQNPRVPSKTLGQNDFLKLLVTQFTNQDPLSPMKDTEYVAQMAQFTSLEQSKAMSADLSALQANTLIGRNVVIGSGTTSDPQIEGTVSAVEFRAGKPTLMVNGQSYELGQVLRITPAEIN